MEFRRVHTPSASGIVTISIETMSSKSTVYLLMNGKLQAKILGLWITIKNYSITIDRCIYEQDMPKLKIELQRIDSKNMFISSVKFHGE